MNIAFDYLQGPELGHRTRCEILKKELSARGHRIVDIHEDRDWLVYDYPTLPTTVPMGYKRLLMGQLPIAMNDYAWHPLGPEARNTMHGARYIMVEKYAYKYNKDREILITCGGSDPCRLTQRILDGLGRRNWSSVVIGPNFGEEIFQIHDWNIYLAPTYATMQELMHRYRIVICTWGQTVFEALLMGASVLPITTCAAHEAEAKVLGAPYITREHDFSDETLLFRAIKGNFGMDYHGAQRAVEQMEAWHVG
jgi:spore coat polysaccharide biosynthesis predicted glycosyltransferase SpsG